MRAFVTGSSGFLGTNLVQRLLRDGHHVTAFDAKPARAGTPAAVDLHFGDLLNLSDLTEAVGAARPDVVFHLGARTDLHGSQLEDYAANTVGTANLIEAIRITGLQPYTVYASSRLVFAIDHKPSHLFDYKASTVYGQSKIDMEKLVMDGASAAGPWSIVRPTSLWGPYFDVPYRDFFDSVRSRKYVHVQGRNPLKTFGFVGNAVHELVSLASAEEGLKHEKVLWLSDFEPLDVRSWANLIADRFEVTRPRTVPLPVLRAAALVGDGLRVAGMKNPPLTSFRLRNLLSEMIYDTSATRSIVGALPYTIEEGVDLTVDWMRGVEQRK